MASEGWFSENSKKALIYGTAATTVVSLLSLSGACIIPLLTGKAKHRWMHFFVAMAVTTLSSDAILHIIPQLMGAHDHSLAHHDHGSISDAVNITQGHDHHHHDSTDDENSQATEESSLPSWLVLNHERRILLRLSAILLLIYLLYFIEFVAYYRRRESRSQQKSEPALQRVAKITQCTETLTNHAWEEEHSSRVTSNEALVTVTNASDAGSENHSEDHSDSPVFWGLKV
ncbi:hypothetical protein ANCDUO_08075 [Ancylostoma duodenale]|uniref:Metal cation transporter, ZIP family n=1 Tax=Ancylostoma duodenale TaxID=51022 RepID=A0A0C2GK89_9BILA|nr:hypothetical protein ANCDUO_08075 [Ancylostoma duodenale]